MTTSPVQTAVNTFGTAFNQFLQAPVLGPDASAHFQPMPVELLPTGHVVYGSYEDGLKPALALVAILNSDAQTTRAMWAMRMLAPAPGSSGILGEFSQVQEQLLNADPTVLSVERAAERAIYGTLKDTESLSESFVRENIAALDRAAESKDGPQGADIMIEAATLMASIEGSEGATESNAMFWNAGLEYKKDPSYHGAAATAFELSAAVMTSYVRLLPHQDVDNLGVGLNEVCKGHIRNGHLEAGKQWLAAAKHAVEQDDRSNVSIRRYLGRSLYNFAAARQNTAEFGHAFLESAKLYAEEGEDIKAVQDWLRGVQILGSLDGVITKNWIAIADSMESATAAWDKTQLGKDIPKVGKNLKDLVKKARAVVDAKITAQH